MLVEKGLNYKALLHTHPVNLIAMTHNPKFKLETELTHLLWSMHPETVIFMPEGIGFIPYILPGTEEIAEKTVNILKKKKLVVWEKHGSIAIGEDIQSTFD